MPGLRYGFIMGLHEMVERLTPSAVVLYGTNHRHIRQALGPKVELLHFPPERTRIRKAA